MATLVSDLTEAQWPSFEASYQRDRIPFLEALVTRAAGRMDLRTSSVLATDGISGCVSLYLARAARDVFCSVDTPRAVTDLTGWLREASVGNVSVRLSVPLRPGGPALFPFLKTTFDAAFLVVTTCSAREVQRRLQEVAGLLKPDGKLGVIVTLTRAMLRSPADVAGRTKVTRARSAPDLLSDDASYDWLTNPVLEPLVQVGFRNVQVERCLCRCVAASRAVEREMQRRRVLGDRAIQPLKNPRFPEPEAEAQSGPVPLQSMSAILHADAPDPLRDMS